MIITRNIFNVIGVKRQTAVKFPTKTLIINQQNCVTHKTFNKSALK